MGVSDLSFVKEAERAEGIEKGSFAKDFYLDREGHVFIKEYDLTCREEINAALHRIHNSETRIREFIPEAAVVMGNNDKGEAHTFLLMRYVNGIPIERVTSMNPELETQFDILLLESFRFAEATGEFPDILDVYTDPDGGEITEFTNIVLGSINTEPIGKPYIVDIWPTKSLEWLGFPYFKDTTLAAIGSLEKRVGKRLCPETVAYLKAKH